MQPHPQAVPPGSTAPPWGPAKPAQQEAAAPAAADRALPDWVIQAVVACLAMVLAIHQSTEFGTPNIITVRASC